jgi:hypothetical protein
MGVRIRTKIMRGRDYERPPLNKVLAHDGSTADRPLASMLFATSGCDALPRRRPMFHLSRRTAKKAAGRSA